MKYKNKKLKFPLYCKCETWFYGPFVFYAKISKEKNNYYLRCNDWGWDKIQMVRGEEFVNWLKQHYKTKILKPQEVVLMEEFNGVI